MAIRSAAWVRIARETTSAAGPARRRQILVAGLAWLAALGTAGLLVRASLIRPPRIRLLDLNVYRDGGLSMLHGGALYAMHARGELLFTYPPVAAVLAVPLALVSWPAAEILWIPVVYVPLAIVIWLAFRPLLRRARGYAPAVLAGLFLCCACLIPVRQEIRYGQVDMLLVALCVIDCAARRRRGVLSRSLPARCLPPRCLPPQGVLIGLATAVKLVPGVFIVYLLVTGRRRAAAVAAATCAAATALTGVVAPRDSVGYWTSAVFNPSRLGPNGPAANQSLRGAILRLWSPAGAPAAVWLAVAVLVAIAGFAAARAVQRRGDELAGIAITGLLAALLSPVAWIHHFCWIVVVLGVLVGDGRNPRRLLTAAAAGALFSYAVPFWGKELLTAQAAPVLLARTVEDAFTIAGLILIVIIFRIRAAESGTGAGVRPDTEPGASQAVAERKVLAGSRGG